MECPISHCWKASVFHPLCILKAFLSPSPRVAGGGREWVPCSRMAARGQAPSIRGAKNRDFLKSKWPPWPLGLQDLCIYSAFHPEIGGCGSSSHVDNISKQITSFVFTKGIKTGGGRKCRNSFMFCTILFHIFKYDKKEKEQVSIYGNG